MNIEKDKIVTCETCAEIVVQGYSDSIEDCDEHKKRVLQVEAELSEGWYFLEECKTFEHTYLISDRCEVCGVDGSRVVYKARNVAA